MQLYRIISFPTFVDLITNHHERYARPCTWEDTHEAYLMKAILCPSQSTQIANYIFKNISQENTFVTISNFVRLLESYYLSYGQCWSKTDESDAMWRCYSYDKMSIRIETTDTEIRNIYSSAKFQSIYTDKKQNSTLLTKIYPSCVERNDNFNNYFMMSFKDIIYDLKKYPTEDILRKQLDQLKTSLMISEPFFHKRQAFQHENEKRVIFYPTPTYLSSMEVNSAYSRFRRNDTHIDNADFLEKTVKNYTKLINEPQFDQSLYLPIPNINTYIKSVLVHPQAASWFVDLTESLCRKYALNFLGKSHLYDLI